MGWLKLQGIGNGKTHKQQPFACPWFGLMETLMCHEPLRRIRDREQATWPENTTHLPEDGASSILGSDLSISEAREGQQQVGMGTISGIFMHLSLHIQENTK